ncbi:MAG: YegS/Rv2252/BmrU family lipid kinase [Actinomycetota bacterium]|nr:YegS/Rv2252/BmrU family lipid kinase [Actinomycetota bacterium]
MLRASFIVNSRAGKGAGLQAAGIAAQIVGAAGIETTIYVPASEEAAALASQDAVARGVDIVVACGGDGTIHTVLQSVAQTSTLFGVIPTGTGDDNARTLGLPLGDPGAAARVITEWVDSPKTIDLAQVSMPGGEQHWYLGVLSTGFDSSVNERANRLRWPRGQARYLLGILGELRTFSPVPYCVAVDGTTYVDTAMLVSVGNGTSYGGGMRVCPNAVIDDGELDITWLHELSKAKFLRVFPSVYKGTHVTNPAVQMLRGKSVTVAAAGQVAYADGERLGPLPVQVQVVPGALRVLAP